MRNCRIIFFALCIAASPCLQAKQLAVVTDTANATKDLTVAEFLKIVNFKMHSWPDGTPVVLVMRDPSSADMQLVLRRALNMTPEQAHAFVQAHKDSIVIADSDQAVLRFVSAKHGAIGIVDLYSLTKDVSVLKVDGKLPVEQGYLLRGN